MLMVANHYLTLTAPGDATLTNHPSSTVTVVGFREMVLGGLTAGIPYYVRVSAENEHGWSAATASLPTNLSPANQLPPAPQMAQAVQTSNTEVLVQWKPPKNDGGLPITKYTVEWSVNVDFDSKTGNAIGHVDVPASDTTGRAEVQAVTLVNSDTSAAFDGHGRVGHIHSAV